MQNIRGYILRVLYLSFVTSPLCADLSHDNEATIPDVPPFTLTYKEKSLKCYPSSLTETKRKKKFVEFVCAQRHLANRLISNTEKISSEEDRGREETKRLKQNMKDQKSVGEIYYVKIPEGDAHYPKIASREAKQILEKNRYFGKYIRWLLPAKLYISLRPQYTDMAGSEDGGHFRNAGSRAGFFYFYEFDNDMDLTFQYEGNVNEESKGRFINLSEQSNSYRRLSYLALDYKKMTLLVGKYWSAYYDIAGWTDYFMAYGAQASGAFNNSGDGSDSGTGRADKILQMHFSVNDFESTVQYQFGHDIPEGLDAAFSHRMGASLVYKGWTEEGWRVGTAFAYARYDVITEEMREKGIMGDDQAYIVGFSYKKDHFLVNGNLSYTKNHMSDDQGIYFNGVGAELYAKYDVTNQIRTVAGFNWLHPSGEYDAKYEIKKGILSFQYTFGKKTFDDVVYVEFSFPHGSLASGTQANTSIAIGLRYLIDI